MLQLLPFLFTIDLDCVIFSDQVNMCVEVIRYMPPSTNKGTVKWRKYFTSGLYCATQLLHKVL